MATYKKIDLHKKQSDVLIIHCADPRFQDAYHYEIGRINSYHDLLVVPGASKAIVDNPSVMDYAKLLRDLHHFKEIHILDHIDCGAFGPVDDEIEAHSGSMKAAQEKLVAAMPDIIVKTYSGGMRRRLEIARGLLHHPKILFLDEPTLGLDTQTRNLLWDYVKKLSDSEGMTIFFTTHYLDEAEAVAQRIAIIDHGKIIATGTTKQLTAQTKTKTLEEAYLQLTGKEVRDETSLKNDGLNVRGALQRQRLR